MKLLTIVVECAIIAFMINMLRVAYNNDAFWGMFMILAMAYMGGIARDCNILLKATSLNEELVNENCKLREIIDGKSKNDSKEVGQDNQG